MLWNSNHCPRIDKSILNTKEITKFINQVFEYLFMHVCSWLFRNSLNFLISIETSDIFYSLLSWTRYWFNFISQHTVNIYTKVTIVNYFKIFIISWSSLVEWRDITSKYIKCSVGKEFLHKGKSIFLKRFEMGKGCSLASIFSLNYCINTMFCSLFTLVLIFTGFKF